MDHYIAFVFVWVRSIRWCTNCSTETSLTTHQCVFSNANTSCWCPVILLARVIQREKQTTGTCYDKVIITKIRNEQSRLSNRKNIGGTYTVSKTENRQETHMGNFVYNWSCEIKHFSCTRIFLMMKVSIAIDFVYKFWLCIQMSGIQTVLWGIENVCLFCIYIFRFLSFYLYLKVAAI